MHAKKTIQRGAARAFTLLEVLVAVGAVALIAVGLATIFDSVGKTVSGGRRVSLLSQYAGLIENRMRTDFDAMTRDGVLVIRQQWTDGTANGANSDGQVALLTNPANPDAVRLHAKDTSPRPRRIDEIVFFARGDFVSARQPLHPDVIADSSEARIYYGHGMQHLPEIDETNLASSYFFPRTDHVNHRGAYTPLDAPLGKDRQDNPNRFASEWTLLRHVTLLVNPESARPPLINGTVFGINPASGVAAMNTLSNNNYQYALQPAAPSIFRAINRAGVLFGPDAPNPAFNVRPVGQSPIVFAGANVFASGIVDIATSDLNEVRAVVTSMAEPSAAMIPGRPRPPMQPVGRFNITPPGSTRPSNPAAAMSLDLAHDWMAQLIPTESNTSPDAMFKIGATQATADPIGARIRYERNSPSLLNDNVINASAGSGTTGPAALARAIRRADQLMLESSGFVARCSEFIVDWSFGQTDATTGRTIWYGPERFADTNNNGVIDGGDAFVTLPYGYPGLPLVSQAYTIQPANGQPPAIGLHGVTQRLIYGYQPGAAQACLTSYFGYLDPTFNADPNTNGVIDAGEPIERSLPWAWPRLVRVTMTLSDPIDPSIESTFQFVFRVPELASR